MRTATAATRAVLLTAALAGAALGARDASACGGYFVGQTEVSQVSGHKMILSVSPTQTTLYDQITYTGSPSSFAWVLPITGTVTVGLSSDALFENLVGDTAVSIQSPQANCPPSGCVFPGTSSGAGGGTTGPGVTVIAQQVVGPYETVQLMSSDPQALASWLAANGYAIPADVQPVIDAYVAEGFNFLALKLVPGQGITSMRPVRVTTPGGSTTLPLRMVAAGTGAITPITLWVIAEARYDTVNLPSFLIDPNQIVWDWDTQSSNYSTLKAEGFAQTQNQGWLVSEAQPFSMLELQQQLGALVTSDPNDSGYVDTSGQTPAEELSADMTALFSDIPDCSMWITRLDSELSRAALGADLQLSVASDQSQVSTFFDAEQTVGTPPACPPPVSCGGFGAAGGGGAGGSGGSTGAGWTFWSGSGGSSGGGCNTTPTDPTARAFAGAALMAALAFARRRAAARRAG